LNRADAGIQLILISGRNKEVAQELHALEPRIPMLIEGFTPRIPYYMELSDFFIGKPGPGSISEALVKHLPVIVERNAWTLAHERYNTTWIEEQGVGVVLKSFSQIFEAVQHLLAPENYNRLRRRASQVSNRAVYEIPLLLDEILSDSQGSPQPAGAGTVKKPS
jgi:1,2-diacylglycerol 3-beta-galactosyltransferase